MACFLIMPSAQRIVRTGQFQATVAGVTQLSPRMRRIELRSPALAEVHWPLGCDIAIVLTGPDGREVRRRYTVRTAQGDGLVVDAVLHGHGPGSTWAAGLTLGEPVTFYGPRGEIPVPDSDRLLAFTDEAGFPAVAAVAEAVPDRRLTVFAEIADEAERYPFGSNVDAHWLIRGSSPAGSPQLLGEAMAALEAGPGFAYVLGESRAIVTLRDRLADLGLSRPDVYAKGYWNLNARPTR